MLNDIFNNNAKLESNDGQNIFEKAKEKKNKRSSSVFQNPIKVDIIKQDELKFSKENEMNKNANNSPLINDNKIQIKSKIRSRQGVSRTGLQSQRSNNILKNEVKLYY